MALKLPIQELTLKLTVCVVKKQKCLSHVFLTLRNVSELGGHPV
jgi:hypothetical protein